MEGRLLGSSMIKKLLRARNKAGIAKGLKLGEGYMHGVTFIFDLVREVDLVLATVLRYVDTDKMCVQR